VAAAAIIKYRGIGVISKQQRISINRKRAHALASWRAAHQKAYQRRMPRGGAHEHLAAAARIGISGISVASISAKKNNSVVAAAAWRAAENRRQQHRKRINKNGVAMAKHGMARNERTRMAAAALKAAAKISAKMASRHGVARVRGNNGSIAKIMAAKWR